MAKCVTLGSNSDRVSAAITFSNFSF